MDIGTDIIEVFRIKTAIEKYQELFLNKVYTIAEQEYCESKHLAKFQHYAGRFAAKEAIFKAISNIYKKSNISWLDIEILNSKTGKPEVYLFKEKKENIKLSISHCNEYATATAILI